MKYFILSGENCKELRTQSLFCYFLIDNKIVIKKTVKKDFMNCFELPAIPPAAIFLSGTGFEPVMMCFLLMRFLAV